MACGTGRVSTTFTVRIAGNSRWPHETEPQLTHDVAMIDLLRPAHPSVRISGLPVVRVCRRRRRDAVVQGRIGTALFCSSSETDAQRGRPADIVVCMAIVRDFPGYMKEFLRYYKHLGVDHVYMTGEDSFFRNGILENDEFVQKALMDSYVSFHVLAPVGELRVSGQVRRCLLTKTASTGSRAPHDYAFLVDSDDHFIPLVPKRESLDFYVERYCRFGSCVFPWVEYFPDCGGNC